MPSEELENSFTKGNDDHPDNLVSACHLINEHKHCTPRSAAPDSSGVAFAQKSEKGNDNHNKNKDDSWQKKATCHHCGEVGHIRPSCPALKDADDKEPDVDKSDVTSKDKKTEKKPSFAQQAAETDNESEPESQFTNFGFCTATSHPSTQDMKSIVKSNLIVNCPVTAEDIDRAEKIYGPSVPILKGKTARQTPSSVASDYVAVPPEIMSANKHVTLSGDLFFINKASFVSTISDHIKFTTAEHIASRKLTQPVLGSQHVQALHAARGFQVKCLLMDGEFVPLKRELASRGIALNTTSANEHVPKIERQIRVIKERVRATRHTLSIKVLPLTMLIELVCSSILWINAFPSKGGVSTNLSPRNIMTGIQFDCNKHCQLQFGSYVQAHQEPDPANTQAARTVGAGSPNGRSHLSWPDWQHARFIQVSQLKDRQACHSQAMDNTTDATRSNRTS
jgi:hypothetical protein